MEVDNRDRMLLGLAALQLQTELAQSDLTEYLTPRSYGWLGEHQDEAAELAALLHEAAPKLALASLRAAQHVGGARPLPKARSYELSDTIRDRLRAAEPMPTGPGQVPWSRLAACISSELLQFDEASDALPGAALASPRAALPSPCSPTSPGVLEINSGGRVFFCLFGAASPAPTPPCSLRNSPEREATRFTGRTAAAAGGGAAALDGLPPVEDVWRQLDRELSLLDGSKPGAVLAAQLAAEEWRGGLQDDAWAAADAERKLQELQAAVVAQQGRCGGALASSSSSEEGDGLRAALERAGPSFSFADGGGAAAPAAGELPPTPRRLRRRQSAIAAAAPQTCLVMKFVPSRLLCQSEQFASELTRHVGLCTPDSRILRAKGSTEGEWQEAFEAAAALRERYPDLHEEMSRNSCCLIMEFIPGSGLFRSAQAFQPAALPQTAEDLGRLFTLDMLLGNPDRLPCEDLSWRGNPENILYATAGRWAGRAVAIDAVVQRRPPGGLKSVEDRSCERLTELALNDAGVAGSLLQQAMQPAEGTAELALLPDTAAAFQRGLKAALDAATSIKGLLEMMFEVVSDWIQAFVEDIEEGGGGVAAGPGGGAAAGGAPPQGTPRAQSQSRRASSAGATTSPLLLAASASSSAQTLRIRQINHEAQRNDEVGEKVAHWKAVFREKGEELRAAVEEWQQKRGTPAGGQHLTTAFLDGTHPIVDVYELKVRLEHMLQRLRVLQQATLTGRPCRLLARLYLSGAVEASSHHLLKHMGITHVLNATEDLLLPEEEHGFVTLRVPLRDMEEEDLGPHLSDAACFIDEGLAKGGAVLVHCHAGKSRSCSLVLSWLMTRRSWPLKRAMDFLQRARPEAAPNAGYLAALLRLEEELFGRQTVKMKKTKPEPRACPECGERVGLSADSVRVHLRLKHPGALLARAGNGEHQDSLSSGTWAELLGSPRATQQGQQQAALAGSADRDAAPLLSPCAQHAGAPAQPATQQQQEQQRLPHLAAPDHGPCLRHEGRDDTAPAALHVAPGRGPGAGRPGAGCGAAELDGDDGLDSPVSMAAALRGRTMDLSLFVGDGAEEEAFLAAATPPAHMM